MLSIDDIKDIPFIPIDKLSWDNWPNYSLNENRPENIDYIFSGDMAQACVHLRKNGCDYLISDAANEINFLKIILENIFSGEMTWADIRYACGIDDYFWHIMCVWNDEIKIERLPLWCNEIFSILKDAGIVSSIHETVPEAEYYYLEDFSDLSFRPLSDVFEKMLSVFKEEAKRHCIESDTLEELIESLELISKIFDGQILENTKRQEKYQRFN